MVEGLRKANEELEAYAHAISHDLRAPLRALQGYASAILEDYSEKLDETGKFYLGRIVNLSEKMDKLVQDLLDYSKLSTADKDVADVDVNNVIEKVIELLEDEIRKKRAEITIHKIPKVCGDKRLLRIVFQNLISNALKFVDESVTPEIEIWAEESKDCVRIFVNNGIGIPAISGEDILHF